MLTLIPQVNTLGHPFDVGYEYSLQELGLRVHVTKPNKQLQGKGIYSCSVPPYLSILNETFMKEGKDAP